MHKRTDSRRAVTARGSVPALRPPRLSFLEKQVLRLFVELAHLHGVPRSMLPIVRDAARLFAGARSIPAARFRWHRRLRSDDEPVAGQPVDRRYILSFALYAMSSPPQAAPGLGAKVGDHACVPAEIAMRVAALLRLATALAHPRGGGTPLVAVLDDGSTLTLAVRGGPASARAVKLLRSRSDLWNAVMPRPIAAVVEVSPGQPLCTSSAGLALPAVAARILLRQLETVVSRTYGVDYVEDPEFIHEMRVAVRKARSACRVFQPVLNDVRRNLKPLLKMLSRVLGAARDGDVLAQFLVAWRDGSAPPHAAVLENLIRHTEAHRQILYGAVWRLNQLPDTQTQLTAAMAWLRARATDASAPATDAAGDAAATLGVAGPAILLKPCRRALAFRRNLKALSPRKLHRLRIACKHLRYTAEFLLDTDPVCLKRIRDGAGKIQQHLGTVRDTQLHEETIVGAAAKSARPLSARDHTTLEAIRRTLARRRRKAFDRAGKAWRRLRERLQEQVPLLADCASAVGGGDQP